MSSHVPAVIAEAMMLLQLVQDRQSASDRCGGTRERLGQDRAFGFEGIAIQRGAYLRDLAQGDDISVLVESEVLECKRAAQSRKRLDFVEDDQHVVLFADPAQRLEVLMRSGVVPPFPGYQLEP